MGGMGAGKKPGGCSTPSSDPHLRIYQSLTLLPLRNCVHKPPNKVHLLEFGRGRSPGIERMGCRLSRHLYHAFLCQHLGALPVTGVRGLGFLHFYRIKQSLILQNVLDQDILKKSPKRAVGTVPVDHRDETFWRYRCYRTGNGPLESIFMSSPCPQISPGNPLLATRMR